VAENKAFIDSNILLYSVGFDPNKGRIARALLENGPIISVQVLNEFVNVSIRKYGANVEAAALALMPIRFTCEVVSLTLETHLLAIEIARAIKVNIYDANILAAAELAGCNILFSEDMNHGQRVGRVTIRNPFKAE
jgi:predicted nucleic acid-binding protein